MQGNVKYKKIIITAVSAIMIAASGYGVAADLAPSGTTTTTTSTTLQPLIQPKPAGSALTVSRPPLTTSVTGVAPSNLNTRPQRNVGPAPTSPPINNANYDALPICPGSPANQTVLNCPDINNKITGTANCPDTCKVSRVSSTNEAESLPGWPGNGPGWNSLTYAPNSMQDAICPSGYAAVAAYNMKPEYIKRNTYYYPYPISSWALYNSYVAAGASCNVGDTRFIPGLCSKKPPAQGPLYGYTAWQYLNNPSPPSDNASPGYGIGMYNVIWTYFQGWDQNFSSDCYADAGCSIGKALTCTGTDWLGNPTGCTQVCGGGDYYKAEVRTLFIRCTRPCPGCLAPTGKQAPASLVCARIKSSWK